ncbi:MAG: acyl-CoA dehydrogenase [Burkholderiaceae bacterium]
MLLYAVVVVLAAVFVLGTTWLRRPLVSGPLLAWYRKRIPVLGGAERAAIEAGTTGFEAELFSGRPQYLGLADLLTAGLTLDERAFLDRQVETLCEMLDDWEIAQARDLPEEVWSYLRQERFFGMVIPREYGGLGFSNAAHAAVVTTLATRSASAAVTVMVPNSLGPAELLLRYGTQEQKNHYLPRLASGLEIPCFALTNPWAGSDAGAIPDTGVAVNEVFEGKPTLGFRVSWSKRYITLGPVATLLGLAFKVVDPDHLLGDEPEPGITCALVPARHPGIRIGRRHAPMHAAFMNGPNSGENVFIPVDWVIGGPKQVGQGWKMLMECLAAGRSISLPSIGIATQMLALRTVGAYAALREQFGVPIGQFDGVAEPLGRMAAVLYAQDGARRVAYHELDHGLRPAVASAILKYHLTEAARTAINDGMDILGGKGICVGPRNFLAQAYQTMPIAITVEGANILTRSLIVFGQGALRCHPYLQREMIAAADKDLVGFDRALAEHAGHSFANALRSFGLMPVSELPAHDERFSGLWVDLHRLSARFAFAADCALLFMGSRLKRQELQSARLGDVLAHLYMAAGALLRWEGEGRREDDFELAKLAAQHQLHQGYQALREFFRNAPLPLRMARFVVMPTGVPTPAPLDRQWLAAARLMMEPGNVRAYLTWAMFIPEELSVAEPVAQLERALECTAELRAVDEQLHKIGTRDPAAAKAYLASLPAETVRIWHERQALIADLVSVDDFAPDEFVRTSALRRQRLAPTIAKSA